MTLQEAKEAAAKKQGFESWASYEEYCQVTAVVKAHPLKMIAMCDLYADIYARAKWDEAATLQRSMCSSDLPHPFTRELVRDTAKPEFKA